MRWNLDTTHAEVEFAAKHLMISTVKGRFRTFLRVCLKRFLANEWDRQRALKRGGGEPTTSLDTAVAEQRFAAELAAGEPPDRLYERQWAMTLLG